MGIDTIEQIDRIMDEVGGRFALTALLQKRVQEVIQGAPQFAEARTPLRSVLAEIESGKIELGTASEDED